MFLNFRGCYANFALVMKIAFIISIWTSGLAIAKSAASKSAPKEDSHKSPDDNQDSSHVYQNYFAGYRGGLLSNGIFVERRVKDSQWIEISFHELTTFSMAYQDYMENGYQKKSIFSVLWKPFLTKTLYIGIGASGRDVSAVVTNLDYSGLPPAREVTYRYSYTTVGMSASIGQKWLLGEHAAWGFEYANYNLPLWVTDPKTSVVGGRMKVGDVKSTAKKPFMAVLAIFFGLSF